MKPKADTESEDDSSEASGNSSEENTDSEKTKKKKRPSDFISKKDRPDHLKSDRKLNELTLDEAIAICRLSAKRAKLDSAAVDTSHYISLYLTMYVSVCGTINNNNNFQVYTLLESLPTQGGGGLELTVN